MAARLLSDGNDDGDAIVAEINVTPLTDLPRVAHHLRGDEQRAMQQARRCCPAESGNRDDRPRIFATANHARAERRHRHATS
jgi:hypothetical protein